MFGSPPPTTRRDPVSTPSVISPRRQKVVLNLYSGPRKWRAAAVEKSFVREAIVSGASGFREKTRSPVATSAISIERPLGRAGGGLAGRVRVSGEAPLPGGDVRDLDREAVGTGRRAPRGPLECFSQ